MFDYPYLEAPALRDRQHQIYQMPPDLEYWVQIQLEMRRQKLQAELDKSRTAKPTEHAELTDDPDLADETDWVADEADASKTVEVYLTERSFRKHPVFVLGYQQEAQHYLLECCYFHIVEPEGNAQGMELVLDQIPLKRVFEEKSKA